MIEMTAVPALNPVARTAPEPARTETDSTAVLLLDIVTLSVTSTTMDVDGSPRERVAVTEHSVLW